VAGKPRYLGYITSAFKVYVGKRKTNPHEQWEGRIAPRVKSKVVDVLASVDPDLVPYHDNKIEEVKNYQSLAPSAQEHGTPIGKLRTLVNSGYNVKIDEANETFKQIARKLIERMGI
jgi:hypothetical protein